MEILKKVKYFIFKKNILKGFIFAVLLVLSSFIFKVLDHNFQKVFGLNKYLNVFDFIFFGFLALFLFKKEKNNLQFKRYFSLEIFLALTFFLLLRVSIYFSNGQIHYKTFVDLFREVLIFLTFFFFLFIFFEKNKKTLTNIFLLSFFTFTFFQVIIAIMQFFLQKRLGFGFLNEPFFAIDDPNSAKVVISNGLKFLKVFEFQNQTIFLRAHGTFFHPNILSGFLNVSIFMTLYFISEGKKKFYFIALLFMQLVALILTFSRAGLFSVFVSFIFFIFLMKLKKYNIKKISIIFLSVCFLGSLIFSKLLIERGLLTSYFQSKKAKELNVSSSTLRSDLNKVAINMIKKKPILGIGFRNFLIKKDFYLDKRLERAYVHNIYLLLAAENGLLTLALFLFFIGLIYTKTIKNHLSKETIVSLSILTSFLIIGFFDHYPISHIFGKCILFMNLAFLSYKINRPLSYFQKAYLCQE